MPNESAVRSCRPDFNAIKDLPYRGLLISSAGEEYDFVSRFFAPACGINEDPVTGSAHTSLTPIWAKALNKTKMKAKQLSPRTGEIMCEMKGDRVIVSGQAVLFSKSEISI